MANSLFGSAQKVRNREFPKLNNPAGLRFTFPFNAFAVTSYEYQLQLQPLGLEWITGCYIDNSQNAQAFQLIMPDTGQRITVPAYSQGVFELLGLASDKVSIYGTTTGNIDLTVTFLNYVPDSANSIWNVVDPNTVIGVVTVNGVVTALPSVGSFINRSGTTDAVLNTSSVLMNANASRRILHVYNPFANASKTNGGILAVSFANGIHVGAAGAMEISPGGSLTFDGSAVPSQQVWISASDASCVYTAYEI